MLRVYTYTIVILLVVALCVTVKPVMGQHFTVNDDDELSITTKQYSLRIAKGNFRYGFYHPDGSPWLDKHEKSGLQYLGSPVDTVSLKASDDEKVTLYVTNTIGVSAEVVIYPHESYLKMEVRLEGEGNLQGSIIAGTSGLAPAYGLGDHAARRKNRGTEVSGFSSRSFGALTDGEASRLVSNFVIFPKQGVACVNVEPNKKIVTVSGRQLVQGVTYGSEIKGLYYFFGPPKQIYSDFLNVRNAEGYKVYPPKYEWFGIGWEAWGALAWDTNHKTVKENVDRYLELGFPLDWMVVGSGFWPKDDPAQLSTTSFGLWDEELYPQPGKFINYFHKKGLKFIIGLRIAFIPNGPYTQEGIDNGYFIEKEGKARLFKLSFPKPECYFLDASNREAVAWYVQLCEKWMESGVDGFKEDLFGYEFTDLPDDKVDAINEVLMDKGVYVMGRNGYLGSPMDLHRYEDFNYNQNQDRGPINGLAYAYSGFPFVYPDIVGGKGLHNMEFGNLADDKLKTYFIRNAQYASLNPSMSFGYGVWNLGDDRTTALVLEAAKMHHRLHPYFYSAAVKTSNSGFPYTMTPLPLAFPADGKVHNRENEEDRGYQWLINETLMACPLYGEDYASATTRDIYLPEGVWIDYDNGKKYEGPRWLENFSIPLDKTPLFVGGTGFVVEQKKGKILARVYATDFQGTTEFYGQGGKTSIITIGKSEDEKVSIKDVTTKKQVKSKFVDFAQEFELIPGHNYEVIR